MLLLKNLLNPNLMAEVCIKKIFQKNQNIYKNLNNNNKNNNSNKFRNNRKIKRLKLAKFKNHNLLKIIIMIYNKKRKKIHNKNKNQRRKQEIVNKKWKQKKLNCLRKMKERLRIKKKIKVWKLR